MTEIKQGLLLIPILIFMLAAGGCTSAQQPLPVNEEQAETESENDAGPVTETVSENTRPEPTVEPEPDPVPPTVFIHGTEYDRNTAYLDLSDCAPEEIPEIAETISEMPEFETIRLMTDEGGSQLSLEDVALLTAAAPEADFIYSFEFYEKTISLSDNEVKYKDVEIGKEGEENIRQALSVLNKCSRFVLDECGVDDEIMAAINEDYPDIKVVWRIHVGNKTALTDDPIIRMTHGITDAMTGPLKYCKDVVYMDLGHDEGISDISFTANMPALECLILSSAGVTDLSPLKNCNSLTWLELVNCVKLKDISPIAGMDSIKYLNISDSGVRDISPVMDMQLDRFSCIGNGISKEISEEYIEKHPDCMVAFSGNPWGYAWRYDDYGYHFFSYYARMREVFRYEERSPGGYVFPEDEEPEEEPAEAEDENSEDTSDETKDDGAEDAAGGVQENGAAEVPSGEGEESTEP